MSGAKALFSGIDAAGPPVSERQIACIVPVADEEIKREFAECGAAGPSKLSGFPVRVEGHGLRPSLRETGYFVVGGARRR